MSYTILVVDDEKGIRWSFSKALEDEGYAVLQAEHAAAALQIFEENDIDLVILDMKLPDMSGLDVMEKMREAKKDILILIITAYADVETAVRAMRMGAYNYRNKPVDPEDLKESVKKALENLALHEEVSFIRNKEKNDYSLKNILGKAQSIKDLLDVVTKVAESGSSTVLIRGETGTGKELVARAIHYSSDRRDLPFVDINCTAIPENLLESELFGYEKGAFTDAKQSRKGVFELADGGTLFMDEIGDMSYAMQAKLLRVLQEKSFKKVGGSKNISVNVRIIASTNMDLEKAIRESKFREDLYYRLKVIPVHLPPLREREDDSLILAMHFLKQFNKEFKKNIKGFETDAVKLIKAYTWPGNIRELKNVLERAVLLENVEKISAKSLMIHLDKSTGGGDRADEPKAAEGQGREAVVPEGRCMLELDDYTLESAEKALIRKALVMNNWNRNTVASSIGINRTTLYSKMKRFGISKGEKE